MAERRATAPNFTLHPALRTEDATELVDLAKNAPLTDGGVMALDLLERALQADPTHHEAQGLREWLFQMFVPRWHFSMMNDTPRNRAYADAIEAKVQPGDIVLDIGCGAGLTAMLAARAGAKHVYSCERQPIIADVARRVIAENGLSDKITVISKFAHDLVVGEDLPEPADVVVSEIVDTMLLGEGAMSTLHYAMTTLAKPGAKAVPEKGRLVAQVVESDTFRRLWRPTEAEGFVLEPFHRFANVAQITPHDLEVCPLRPLGPQAHLFGFDFAWPSTRPGRIYRNLPCAFDGRADAVVVSFEMDLAPGITVSNGLADGGHWGRTAFLLPDGVYCAAGDRIAVTAQHDAVKFSLVAEGRVDGAAGGQTVFQSRGALASAVQSSSPATVTAVT